MIRRFVSGAAALVLFVLPGAVVTTGSMTSAASQAKPAPGDAVRGSQVFLQQQCSQCHMVRGRGGQFGPELTTVGDRRDAEWLLKYLPKPQAFDPKNKMPPVMVKGRDLDDLVAYLVSLKGKTLGD